MVRMSKVAAWLVMLLSRAVFGAEPELLGAKPRSRDHRVLLEQIPNVLAHAQCANHCAAKLQTKWRAFLGFAPANPLRRQSARYPEMNRAEPGFMPGAGTEQTTSLRTLES